MYLLAAGALSWVVVRLLSGVPEPSGPTQLGLTLALVLAVGGCLLSALARRFFALAAGAAVSVYVVVRLALTVDAPSALVPNGVAIAIEAALLLGLAWLARRVVNGVNHLEECLALEAVPQFSPLVERAGLLQDLAYRQFGIAMRHGRSLSAIVLRLAWGNGRPTTGPSVGELGRLVTELHGLGRLALVAAKTFRRTDIAMKAEGHRTLILICPETGPEGAQRLAEKIRLAAEEKLGQRVDFGVASFPEEALNLEELVHHANSKLEPQGPPTTQRSHAASGRG